MTNSAIQALLLFSLVSSITPGPNNIMLLSSGVRFGFKATIPHIFGVSLGHAFLVFCVAIGLSQLFNLFSWLHLLLKISGGGYMVYLAYKIAISPPPGESNNQDKDYPMSFYSAALFQWINPKGWIMAIGAIAAFLPTNSSYLTVLFFSLTFAVVNLPCVTIWALFGANLRRWLRDPWHLKMFNYIMSFLLLISLIPMLQ